jgi:serine/threonine-protein kinase
MATVYLATSCGEAGFSRLVAIKTLHPHLADQEDFVAMLLDEARLAARIHHPNVVPVVDLQSEGSQRYIVMEYVEGCSLSHLLKRQKAELPLRVVVTIIRDALSGLHAAHTLTDEAGTPLNLIHRDVTPHNILVGVDGMARLTDFGVAFAESRIHHTRQRELKGKIAFMAPEQIQCLPVDHRADIFSAGCLLWFALTGRSLFLGPNDAKTLSNVLEKEIVPPIALNKAIPEALSSICTRALERDPNKRWSSAMEMEAALHQAAVASNLVASRTEIGEWVKRSHQRELDECRLAVREASMVRSGSFVGFRPGPVVQPEATPRASARLTVDDRAPESPPPSENVLKNRRFFRSHLALALAGAIVLSTAGGALAMFATRRSPVIGDASIGVTSPPARASRHPTMESPPLPSSAEPTKASPSVKPAVVALPATPTTTDEPAPAPVGAVAKRSRATAPRRPLRMTSPVDVPADSPTTAQDPPPSKASAAWDKDSPLPPQ